MEFAGNHLFQHELALPHGDARGVQGASVELGKACGQWG